MKTSGAGSEGLLIIVAASVLLVVGILISGGVREFFNVVDGTIQQVAGGLIRWIRVWL